MESPKNDDIPFSIRRLTNPSYFGNQWLERQRLVLLNDKRAAARCCSVQHSGSVEYSICPIQKRNEKIDTDVARFTRPALARRVARNKLVLITRCSPTTLTDAPPKQAGFFLSTLGLVNLSLAHDAMRTSNAACSRP